MAAILLCDQFSRNMFRKQKQAFEYDPIALSIVTSITQEQYKQYSYQEKMFLVMPLMHGEKIEHHRLAVGLVSKFVEETKLLGEEQAKGMIGVQKFLDTHMKIIEQFGRYPHRNDVLGRQSTPEEIEYLKTAERFGQ